MLKSSMNSSKDMVFHLNKQKYTDEVVRPKII
jgi:hypothetical protein